MATAVAIKYHRACVVVRSRIFPAGKRGVTQRGSRKQTMTKKKVWRETASVLRRHETVQPSSWAARSRTWSCRRLASREPRSISSSSSSNLSSPVPSLDRPISCRPAHLRSRFISRRLTPRFAWKPFFRFIFSARCNMYISFKNINLSVRLSVCPLISRKPRDSTLLMFCAWWACRLGTAADSRGPSESCASWGYSWAPPGECCWTIPDRWRCLLSLTVATCCVSRRNRLHAHNAW